jgi:hypothetical protein
MPTQTLTLTQLQGIYAIHRFPPGADVPGQVFSAPFFSVTRSADELSVVVPEVVKIRGEQIESSWACFRVNGPLPLDMIGVLAKISSALAAAKVSIFAVSTYDTDYVLVKADKVDAAVKALAEAGCEITHST